MASSPPVLGGGLGSYQLRDPSLAASPDWVSSRGPSANLVRWGGNYDPVTGTLGVLPFFVGGSEAQDASYFAGGDTSNIAGYSGVLETGLPTYNFSTRFGKPTEDYITLNPESNQPTRIVDASGKPIIEFAPGDTQGLVKALDAITAEGNTGQWILQSKTGENWTDTYRNVPEKSVLGQFADVALPLALSLTPLGPIGGAAAGSALSSVAQGRSLQDTLLRAGISAGTAFGLDKIGFNDLVSGALTAKSPLAAEAINVAVNPIGGLGGAALTLPALTAPTVGSLGSSILGSVPGEILVQGARNVLAPTVSNLASSAVGSGLGNIGASIINDASLQRLSDAYDAEQMDTVTGRRIPKPTIPPAAFAVPAAAAAASQAASQGANAAQQATETVGAEETVTGKKIPPAKIPDPTLIDFSGAPFYVPQTVIPPFSPPPTVTAKKPLTAAEIARLGLGGLTAIQGLANLFGGSGSGSPGIGSGFNETVSFQPLNRTRNVATFDPFTYGQSSGEFRFFGNERPVFQVGIGSTPLPAPIAPTTPGPDAGIAPEPEPVNKKRGGPIRGIGGGQDDKIPAMLSDGEYVFSAQDVADLGDGSNDEGARRLDEMRKLIRKQAGRRNTKTIAKPQKSVSSLLRAAR
jgi:hypothetical protein